MTEKNPYMRLFGPCDPASGKAFNHGDCMYFNDLDGARCSCSCHTEQNIIHRMLMRPNFGIMRTGDKSIVVEIRGKDLHDLDGEMIGKLL